MPEKIAISSDLIPAPFGHYSQAIKYESMVYISGLYPVNVKTGQLAGPDAAAQSEQVFTNLSLLMNSFGAQLSNVLMLHVYIVDYRDLPAYEAASKKYFFFVPPARTLVPVPWLPYGSRVSLDAVVQIPPVESKGGMLF